MNKKYEELFRYIAQTDDGCASDIMYSVELLRTSLDITMKRIKEEIRIATDSNSFDGISQIASYCKQISEIDNELESVAILFANIRTKENPITTVRGTTIDYSTYDTNRFLPHSIDEHFTNKRICRISIDGMDFSVVSWQDALLKVCGKFYEINPNTIYKLMNDERFKKKKTSLFMKQSIIGRNKLLLGTDIYVWVNNNAMTIARQIRELAEEYGISKDRITVYLSRDLTEMYKH